MSIKIVAKIADHAHKEMHRGNRPIAVTFERLDPHHFWHMIRLRRVFPTIVGHCSGPDPITVRMFEVAYRRYCPLS